MSNSKQYLVCVKSDGYASALVGRRIYRALPDKDATDRRLVCVIDESGEDYLFPESHFEAIELPKALQRKLTSAT